MLLRNVIISNVRKGPKRLRGHTEQDLSVNAGWVKSYAFLPQMDPLYQFLHVLKYFFLVPMTCCRAHTLGLEEEVRGGNVRCREGGER